jgi:hypothetical protein
LPKNPKPRCPQPLEQHFAGAPQLGAQVVGQQLAGAAQAGAHAAGAGQQLLAAGAVHAGAQAGAGAQQAAAGAGQQLAGAAHAGAQVLVQQPLLCLPNRPNNRPCFFAGLQHADGQQVSQHGGLMSEQRR